MQNRGSGISGADTIVLIGDVKIGGDWLIWPDVVIRSDTTPIRVGKRPYRGELGPPHLDPH
jgi:hypothetical protein